LLPARLDEGGTFLNLRAFIKKIESDGYAVAAFVSQQVFETDAWVFLGFARDDLLDGTDRGRVNALSNAKRAVENRVDTLLYAYGLRGHSKKERWNYPTKAEKLRLTGTFVPDALRHMVTTTRNELEHDYKIPQSGQDVADMVDVAELFVRNTDALILGGFFRWILGPSSLLDHHDVASWKVESLPLNAFGLLVDRPKRLFRIFDGNQPENVSFSAIDAAEMAELFRLLKAAFEPRKTQIVGPIDEVTFVASYL
jgi:hypothetical protein